MRAVENRLRRAPVAKQRPLHVEAALQALSAERLRRTPGFEHGSEPGAQEGLARLLTEGRAASTDRAYFNAFERVRRWSERVGVCPLPMLPFHFLRYLWALFQHCQERGLARSNIDVACAAVERFHTLAGHPSPTADVGVQEVRKGMGRSLGVRGHQAFPLTDGVQERLWQCVQSHTVGADGLLDFTVLLTIAVMREGVLRWDDVSRVEFRDVMMTEQYARIFVLERKTDERREGMWVMLPYRAQPWAAYQLLLQAPVRFAAEFQRLPLARRGAWLLDHPCLSMWQGGQGTVALNSVRIAGHLELFDGVWLPAAAGVCMSYNRFQDLFRKLLKSCGEDPAQYSTHSMRRGGASDLRQQGLSEDLIAQHGGWKSRSAMMRYFDGSVEFARRADALRSAVARNARRGVDVSDVAQLRDLF